MAGELILTTLSRAWGTLHDRGIPACVMGGLALAHWGHARFTKDVDLLVLLDPHGADELAGTLAAEGFVARRAPVVSRVGQHSFVQLMFTPKGRFDEVSVDLLLADSDFLCGAVQRAIPLRLGSLDGRVVRCEDLILLKLQADRVIDRMDVRYLLAYNRANLDFNYLGRWLHQLGLTKEWAQWWEEAFPGERAPIDGL